jgi:spermidine synthase
MPVFALTIFIGAFLLFQVQPLIGKYILPWFGGGPGVWTTCMLFFQVLLLGGYAYAHFTSKWLKPRVQVLLHLLLLAAALALLPITPNDAWKPQAGGNPVLQILALLGASLGLPYFVLSATGPLLQQWFSQTNPGRSPYRLYALSNVGSLLALLSYPFFFETHFTRKAQAGLWAAGLAAYVVCCGWCALKLWKAQKPGARSQESGAPSPETEVQQILAINHQPSTINYLLWLLLPACASALLLATTNKMCQDVAVIPFLWVLPLALYLLSFIICFDSPRWYVRFPFALALVLALGAVCVALFAGIDWPLGKQIAVYTGALFVCCMVCHGELYRRKPDPRHLTAFYLMIAAGGALGGAFVAVAAPALFTDYYELHWGLLLCGLLFIIVCAVDRPNAAPKPGQGGNPQRPWIWLACALTLMAFGGLDRLVAQSGAKLRGLYLGHLASVIQSHEWGKNMLLGLRIALWAFLVLAVSSWVARQKHRSFRHWRLLSCGWLSLGLVVLGVALWRQAQVSRENAVAMSRNFYGVLTVYEYRQTEPYAHHVVLQHGRITHGLQFVDKAMATWPTSYYGMESGIGLGMCALPTTPRRIGVVGLGTGSLTVYGRTNDYFRIYEINPQVEQLAGSRFTYLSNCQAKLEVVRGDARLSLERELQQGTSQQFDLLALDAFSSDAVPVHLLTQEAFALYERHLKPNGIIAVNVSNHYIDLEPVLVNVAHRFNYHLCLIDVDETEDDWWLYASTWVLLTRSDTIANSEPVRMACSPVSTNAVKLPMWTDDFASLFQVLK